MCALDRRFRGGREKKRILKDEKGLSTSRPAQDKCRNCQKKNEAKSKNSREGLKQHHQAFFPKSKKDILQKNTKKAESGMRSYDPVLGWRIAIPGWRSTESLRDGKGGAARMGNHRQKGQRSQPVLSKHLYGGLKILPAFRSGKG